MWFSFKFTEIGAIDKWILVWLYVNLLLGEIKKSNWYEEILYERDGSRY